MKKAPIGALFFFCIFLVGNLYSCVTSIPLEGRGS